MRNSTMAVSSKYTQDLSVQIVFFTFSCQWFLYSYFWAVIWSYIVDLFAALHELASASARTLLKLASSVRALLKPFGDTLIQATLKLLNKKWSCWSPLLAIWLYFSVNFVRFIPCFCKQIQVRQKKLILSTEVIKIPLISLITLPTTLQLQWRIPTRCTIRKG